jgi:hypothetical protein
MTISDNTILKKAQRLARADRKQLGKLPMVKRREYIEKARELLSPSPSVVHTDD